MTSSMKTRLKQFLSAVALTASASAIAGPWIDTGINAIQDNEPYHVFISSVKINQIHGSKIVSLWSLSNFDHPATIHGFQSIRTHIQIDCSSETYKSTGATFFSGQMASGMTMRLEGEDREGPIPPATVISGLHSMLCR